MSDTFRCAACGGVFEKDWTEQEAIDEAANLFPGHDPADMAIICDECFRKAGFDQ